MKNHLPEVVAGQLLSELHWTLAVAESCTGGLVGHRLTNIPGSSAYFLGGIIAYAYEVKVKFLDVRQETLELHGAVSQETVLEMARGVRQRFQANIGLSISGIAGPEGGSPEKPVGLVWIGLSAENLEQAANFHWQGDRLQVKEQSANQALEILIAYLKAHGRLKKAEEVQVSCRFDLQGGLHPINFVHQGVQFQVRSIGRQWVDEAGKHVLVMDQTDQVHELLFMPHSSRWLLFPVGKQFPTA
jgi:PncC family amidohydrolase